MLSGRQESTESNRLSFEDNGYLSGLTFCDRNRAKSLYLRFLEAEKEIDSTYNKSEVLDPRRTQPEEGWFVLTHRDWEAEHHPLQELVSDIVNNPQLVSTLQEILGTNILLRNVDFISKEVGSGRTPLGWHTDTHHHYERSRGLISAWMALTDATKENGCMTLIKGSHRHQFQTEPSPEKHLHLSEESLAELTTYERVAPHLDAGQFCLHHARTVHGSQANHTGERRLGMVLRIFNAECPEDVADTQEALLITGDAKAWKNRLRATVPIRWHKRD